MSQNATIEDLARAADDAGARLAEQVDDLTERLRPGRLVDEAVASVKARSLEAAREAGGVIKAHPVAIGVGAAAVGLALFAGNRIAKAELDLGHDHDVENYSDYDVDSAGPTAAVADTGVTADAAALVKENPIVAILAGLAAGAALALLFPTSSAEKRSLGALARRVIGG